MFRLLELGRALQHARLRPYSASAMPLLCSWLKNDSYVVGYAGRRIVAKLENSVGLPQALFMS